MGLVLSRKADESVRIGDDIEVTVVEIGRGKVRLLFKVPPHVKIVRSELIDRPRVPSAADIIRALLPRGS